MAGEAVAAALAPDAPHNAVAVKKLAHLLLATKDSLEVMRLLRSRLRDVVSYQRLSILFYNESSHYFYVDADLDGNTSRPTRRQATTVLKAADTGLAEILATRRSLMRTFTDDLRPTPAERQFFGERLMCELAVPMLLGERVLGIFHFSGDRPDCFSIDDRLAAEELAADAALALERTRLVELAQRKKDEAARWRDRYYRVFRAAGEAIAMVNWRDDLIYESNNQFARLSGRSDAELHGMRFTEIFSPESRPEVLMALSKVESSEETSIKEVQLLKKGGEQPASAVARLTLFQIPSRRAVAIAVLQDRSAPRRGQHSPATAGGRRSRELAEMTKLWQELLRPDGPSSLEEILNLCLNRLGELFKARYAAVFLSAGSPPALKLALAKRIGNSRKRLGELPLLTAIGEGPYAELLAEEDLVTIREVFTDARFQPCRAIAEKLGYVSLIAAPLRVQRRAVGLLCLYFDRQRQGSEEELSPLRVVAAYLTLAIENNRLFTEAGEHAKRIAVINEITRLINSSLDMREVIRITAVEAKRVVDFDLATISLFDEEGGENLQILSIASQRLVERALAQQNGGKSGNGTAGESPWAPFFEGATLGWLKDKFPEHNEPVIPKTWLRSEITAMLLSQERFLGTLTLNSLEARAYQTADQEFLKQIAGQMAIAIGNARLFSDVQQRVSEFSALAEVSSSISGSLEVDDVLKQMMKALVRILGVSGCRVQLLGKDSRVLEYPLGTFPPLDWLAIGKHRQTLLEQGEPVLIKNLAESLPGVVDAHARKLAGALLAHPVTSRERVIGVLYAWWEEARDISRHDQQVVVTIASQAASVIENARMYEESIVNTRQLEKVNEELESFVFTVSHDLKSPIASIQGFSSILLDEYKQHLDETAQHYLERIQINANQMERLIADLLDLSRIGRVVNPFEEVPALDIINHALTDFAYPLEEKKIRLHIQEDMPVIWCDPQRLSQVFTNLIGNAIKFTGNQPQPQIEIGCDDKGSHVLFFVKDNGIGIDEKYHEKIFGLFQGLHNLKGAGGTGVGLTIVRRIVDNHGGKVWVESSEGNGATFYFTLPKKPLAAVPPS
jgi:signal transduction histidine kinase/putative methionine-R-sulfoxide reductase with GAF domain